MDKPDNSEGDINAGGPKDRGPMNLQSHIQRNPNNTIHTLRSFNKHRTLWNTVVAFLAAVVTLLGAEGLLRLRGSVPGYLPRYAHSGFNFVPELEISDLFITDEDGVFRANPRHQWMQQYHINRDGFRTKEFIDYSTAKPKVLFLGDSFTWGLNAEPISNCFVDRIDSLGYLTFNTGIPGADPTQYAYLAEKYTPLVKPDIVAIMFYLGNDITPPRPRLPHEPLHYITNAGWLAAYDANGNHLSLSQAYDRQLALYNAAFAETEPGTLRHMLYRVFMKSVVGTHVWVASSRLAPRVTALLGLRSLEQSTEVRVDGSARADMKKNRSVQNTRACLSRIRLIAEEQGAAFALFFIPLTPPLTTESNSVESALNFFDGFQPFVPDSLTFDDYVDLPDDHLNNQGHEKLAEYIIRSFKTLSLTPLRYDTTRSTECGDT